MILSTITFIRHGQSVANAGGVSIPHPEIPLSPLGETQSRVLADLLPHDPPLVLTSDYLRTQQTAAPFVERIGRTARQNSLLHEFDNFDFSVIKGLTGDQREPIREAYWAKADPHYRMGPQAETFYEFEQRVQAFMPQLDELPHGTVVFGHGMWIGLMIWKQLGFSAGDATTMSAFRRFQLGLPMPNCAVYHLNKGTSGRWHVQVDEQLIRAVQAIRLVQGEQVNRT